jgi:hypothetical protein
MNSPADGGSANPSRPDVEEEVVRPDDEATDGPARSVPFRQGQVEDRLGDLALARPRVVGREGSLPAQVSSRCRTVLGAGRGYTGRPWSRDPSSVRSGCPLIVAGITTSAGSNEEDPPLAGHALERVLAPILEVDP